MGRTRTLLALAWPIVVSRSSQVVIGFSDAAMVGRLGESALAATTTGALNAMSLFILPMGISFIVSSFSSQLTGQGDLAGARRYGWYGLVVAAATQVLALTGGLAVPWALGWFDYTPEVRALMTEYLVIRLYGGGAAIGIEALANFYGGLGNTRLPMIANVLAMAANVGLNWVLIYGRLGAPALGVAGAAWASAAASGLGFALLFGCFLRGVGAPVTARARLRLGELLRMLRFGLPSGLNWFFEFAAFVFFINVVVAGLGTTSLAALMAVMQLNSVAFMPAFGLASAGAILVGQAIGARRHDEVPALVRATLRVAAAWQALAGLAYLTLPGLLMRAFVDPAQDTAAFQEVGARMLAISAAWQLSDASAGVLAEALRAAGDTTFTLAARIVLAWAVFVPGTYVAVRWLGGRDVTVMLSLVVYLSALAGVLWLRFRGGAWRHIELTGPPVH